MDAGGTVTQISTGAYQTLALLDNGHIRHWVPTGAETPAMWTWVEESPRSLPGPSIDVRCSKPAVSVAGQGGSGQLGYGNTKDNFDASSAVDVDLGGTVIQMVVESGACGLVLTTARPFGNVLTCQARDRAADRVGRFLSGVSSRGTAGVNDTRSAWLA